MELLEQVYTKKYGNDLVLDRNEWAKRTRFFNAARFFRHYDQCSV